MLSATLVRDINQRLSEGNSTAALSILEEVVDLRWNELPKLEKPTLTAISKYLRDDASNAQALAEAAFHPNITLRRFVKKLVQSLKANAAPIARPLRARLEKHLAETIALEYTFKPKEAALRREQADLLNNAVELLRRCDLDEFMDCLGEMLVQWHHVHEKEHEQTQALQPIQEDYGKKLWASWKVAERRSKEIFKERYAHLGIPFMELQQTSLRLWNELEEAVKNDPDVVAAQPEPINIPDSFMEPPDDSPKTLVEQPYPMQRAFSDALQLNWVWDWQVEQGKQPGAEQERILHRFWNWIEEDLLSANITTARRINGLGHVGAWRSISNKSLRERAIPLLAQAKAAGRAGTPSWKELLRIASYNIVPNDREEDAELPPTITAKTIRALQCGDEHADKTLNFMAQRVEQWQAKQGQATASLWAEDDIEEDLDAEIESDEDDEHEDDDDVLSLSSLAALDDSDNEMQRVAAQFNTVEERLAALCDPPIVEQRFFLVKERKPASRSELLEQWRRTESWQEQEAELSERVLPLLFGKLHEARENYHAGHKRRVPVTKLNEAAAAVLTEKEKREWQKKKLEDEQFDLMVDFDDVVDAIQDLGGWGVYPQVFDVLEGDDLRHYRSRHIKGAMSELCEAKNLDAEALPVVREICRRIAEDIAGGDASGDNQEWEQEQVERIMARSLYQVGTPESMAEARMLVASRNVYDSDIIKLALERRDYEIFVPLVRSLLRFYDNDSEDLQALWDEMRAKNPQCAAACIPELLQMLVEATDIKRIKMPLAMLERVHQGSTLFDPHFDLLIQCVESTVPNIARFALARLEDIKDIDNENDWVSLCERAGEKLWSENAGLAKDAAKFLGAVGARYADTAPVAWNTLCDALTLDTLPLLEVVLRSLAQIKTKQDIELENAARERIEQLQTEYSSRLGRACERVSKG